MFTTNLIHLWIGEEQKRATRGLEMNRYGKGLMGMTPKFCFFCAITGSLTFTATIV